MAFDRYGTVRALACLLTIPMAYAGLGIVPASISPANFVWWALAVQEFLVSTLAEHGEEGPKILELTCARCGVACPDAVLSIPMMSFDTTNASKNSYLLAWYAAPTPRVPMHLHVDVAWAAPANVNHSGQAIRRVRPY